MTFQDFNLPKTLLNALNDIGISEPTSIQEKAYPVILSGRDTVAIAQTGTGKTFAYLIPILKDLKFSKQQHPRILILVPTRELVLQVVGEIEKLTAFMSLRCEGVYGGTSIRTQGGKVFEGLDILVATPGRLIDLTLNGVLRLKMIQKLVIDEVDEMMNLGIRSQLENVLDLLPAKRQNLMFSATLSGDVRNIIKQYFTDPLEIIDVPHGTPLSQIVQQGYFVPNFYTKINLLKLLLETDPEMSKVIVFIDSKRLADEIYETLQEDFGDEVGIVHSNKSQNQRKNFMKRFDEGEHRILIATDLVARGVDIDNVSHVINFDMPEIPGDYIHRIGRTGRQDKAGVAISLIKNDEEALLKSIESFMKKEIEILGLPEDLQISLKKHRDEKAEEERKGTYVVPLKVQESQGAFHEKKGKNKKVNLGGPGRIKDRAGLPSKRHKKKYK